MWEIVAEGSHPLYPQHLHIPFLENILNQKATATGTTDLSLDSGRV